MPHVGVIRPPTGALREGREERGGFLGVAPREASRAEPPNRMNAMIQPLTEPASIERPVTVVPGYLGMSVEIMTMPSLDQSRGAAAVAQLMPRPLTGAVRMDWL